MKKTILAGLLFSCSCKSTESINRFAKSASAGLTEINRSSLSFNEICHDYSQAALAPYTDTSKYGNAVRPAIRCQEFKPADSLTSLISETLITYFSLLYSVSDKKLLAYDARDLVNALSNIQSSVYPSLSISSEKISAVKGLLNTVLNEPLKYYRYRKLVRTMQENDAALTRVLSAYSFILDTALSGEIDQAKENYTSFVYAPMYLWSHTPVEKVMVNRQYQQYLNTLEKEKDRIRTSYKMLILLQIDHHMLAFGKPPAGFAYTEAEISQDIVLINKMIRELIQLIQ